ncbi:hypothetical protein [Pontimicrobium sp. SW4]|uniref:RagB/SusD family nutrient uptake outer membrane protein n=1 Tax=Pontimicrobium sp. SW4 TaxID=3153519 RepID=A0AAU7BUC7_9FLAO
MKKTINLFLIITLLIFTVSCDDFSTDLNVDNLENPNDDILTSDPVALSATADGLTRNLFMTSHSTNSPAAAFATMADITSCSWGNFGMRDLSSEPRVAFNNSPAYGNNVTNSYFNSLYSILSDANTLALAVENGTEFDDPNKIMTIARFGQASAIAQLALVFDQVWLSDETGVVAGTGLEGASDYATAMTFALEKLDDAISIASVNGITFDEAIIPGGAGVNAVKYMNSLGARWLVSNVRNSAQKATIDWDRVLDYTQDGITEDFEIYMDNITWWDNVPKTYLVYPGWARVDMRVINMMDPSTPAYWEDGVTFQAESTSDDARLATDYGYLSSNNFRPERGQYHYSSYRYSRYDDYITYWTMNVVEYSKSENDMYMAEAMAHLGDVPGAAAVINAGTRVTRGGLAPVAENLDAVKDAIHYERMVEFAYTAPYIGFCEMRKEDLLQAGTLLHFPVPGRALEAIPAEYYTLGGTEGIAGEDYSTGGWR